MSKLTQASRERINKRAVLAAFSERRDEFRAQEHSLGMDAYRACFPAEQLSLAASLPDGWVRRDACLRFNAEGWSAELCVDPPVPVPHSPYCRPLGSLTGELAERVKAHMQAKEQVREAARKTEAEMTGFLSQFRSFKEMREAWPEGAALYDDLDVERTATGVPAVRVAEINKLLNLQVAA